MKTVASYPLQVEAHLAVSRLRSAGIEARTENEFNVTFNWLASPALGWVRVIVPDDEEEAARELLAQPPAEAGMLCCPYCGSGDVHVRAMRPLAALGMWLKIPLPLHRAVVDCHACKRSHLVPLDGGREN